MGWMEWMEEMKGREGKMMWGEMEICVVGFFGLFVLFLKVRLFLWGFFHVS